MLGLQVKEGLYEGTAGPVEAGVVYVCRSVTVALSYMTDDRYQ